jgi:competence protein ComEC
LLFCVSCGSLYKVTKVVDKGRFEGNNYSETASTSKNLQIIVFDVGEGSSWLIVPVNGEAILIDAGPPLAYTKIIKPFLAVNEITLSKLILTHGDIDHSGGAEEVGIAPEILNSGDEIDISGDATLQIVAKDCLYMDGSEAAECKDDNEKSAVILVSVGQFRFLSTADLPGGGGDGEYKTIDLESHIGELVGDIDVLLVGHHGSKSSTNEDFLKLITPEIGIISIGNFNDYYHPHKSVIERLLNNGVKIIQTEKGYLSEDFVDDVIIKNDHILIEAGGSSYSIY